MSIPEDAVTFQVRQKIAEGEFAEIFLVDCEGQSFTLKKLKNYLKFDREFTELLEKEADLLERIQDQDHFPILKQEGQIGDEKFLVMEWLDGIDIGKIVEAQAPIIPPLAIVARIILEIAEGLKSLHATQREDTSPCVHGDLRPSNVMLTKGGKVKLIDLGQKGGTFIYMPLGRMHSRDVTPYTDLYALGHIFYELTHGQKLYKPATRQESYFEMRENPVRLERFSIDLLQSWREILFDLLQQDSEPRFNNGAELVAHLRPCFEQEGPLASAQDLARWVQAFGSK